MIHSPRFDALRFLVALKSARDFGLPRAHADAIALRYDARRPCCEHLVDDLASTLVRQGVVRLPA